MVPIDRNGRGVFWMFNLVIAVASRKNLQGFMKDHISPEANFRTDQLASYKGLDTEFPDVVCEK
jgi:hypothetical protein